MRHGICSASARMFRFARTPVWGIGLILATGIAGRLWAESVSVTDYVVPESKAERLQVDFLASHMTEGNDLSITSSHADIGGDYRKFYDSLPFGYTLDVAGRGSVNRDDTTGDYDPTFFANFSGSVKQYVFGRLKGESGGFLSDFFGSVRFNGRVQDDYDQPATSVTLGIGYGRFIDATALAKAVRIEEFLRDEEEITDALPKETLLEIGHIIERRDEYQDLYGGVTYKKYWYADIEDAIGKANLLAGDSLGAGGILRIDEVIERERVSDRFYGWDVVVGSSFDLTQARDTDEDPEPKLDVTANYARPIRWEWQVSERFRANSPFDQLGDTYLSTLASDLSYELSNRVDLRFGHLLTVEKLESRGQTEVSHSLGISFNYYLENAVNVVLSEQIQKAHDGDLRTSFSATLNYRVF